VPTPDFIAFSDESGTSDQYRSIAVATCPYAAYKQRVHRELGQIVKNYGIREFKWEKLRTARHVPVAADMVAFTLKHTCESDLRVDVLTWDVQDSRHAIMGRNDIANFERMFYHLLNNTMRRRPRGSTWRIYPDKGMPVDWQTVQDCLAHRGRKRTPIQDLLYGVFLDDPHYSIEWLREADSHEAPLCQLADLFAGMAAFSVNRFGDYCDWQATAGAGGNLLGDLEGSSFSGAQKARFPVIDHLCRGCRERRMSVSFKSLGRLHTYKPSSPINFWFYTSQGPYDVAPRKGQ